MTRQLIGRPCTRCGKTTSGSQCRSCAGPAERRRQNRQPYRLAYFSPEYKAARRARMRIAREQCERILPGGARCLQKATESHHVIPLSSARTYAAAIALCTVENLEAVCHRHNPREGRRRK